MYEYKHVVECNDISDDYNIMFHELRGYDSPDRWYTCWFKGTEIGQVASIAEAINFCSAHEFAALMAEGDFGHTLGMKYTADE